MRKPLPELALALAAFAAALAAAEGVLRLLRPGLAVPPVSGGNPFWSHDPELGWISTPGARGTFSSGEFSHQVSINRMGFRDPERRLEDRGSGGPLRVAVLGDSFTWGFGVEDEEIFTRLLERSVPGIEVWNLGVSSYSTDQELLIFRRVRERIDPDLVLLMICRNDFAANTTRVAGSYFKPRFLPGGGALELAGVPVPPPTAATATVSWLRRHSAFLNGLWILAEDAGLAPRRPEGWEAQEQITRILLDALREEASRSGAELVTVIVPSTDHVYGETIPAVEARGDGIVRAWGAERGARVLDLTPGFRRSFREKATRLHYERDGHWNAAGHALAAELLASMLAPGLRPAEAEVPPAAGARYSM